MKVAIHANTVDVRITDDEGNNVLSIQISDYNVVGDTEVAIKAIKELIEQAKPLVE